MKKIVKLTESQLKEVIENIINEKNVKPVMQKEQYRPDSRPPYYAKNEDEVIAIVFDFVKRNQNSKNSIASRIADGLKY